MNQNMNISILGKRLGFISIKDTPYEIVEEFKGEKL